jgi:hypothetical protein
MSARTLMIENARLVEEIITLYTYIYNEDGWEQGGWKTPDDYREQIEDYSMKDLLEEKKEWDEFYSQ